MIFGADVGRAISDARLTEVVSPLAGVDFLLGLLTLFLLVLLSLFVALGVLASALLEPDPVGTFGLVAPSR